LNSAAIEVCSFYEEMGEMQRLGVLRAESVWTRQASAAQGYWLLCKPAIEKMRQEWKLPAIYEEFEHLNRVLADLQREQGIESHPPKAAAPAHGN